VAFTSDIHRHSDADRAKRAGRQQYIGESSFSLIQFRFLLSIAWEWSALVIDQMPCFLGVPNCD
jgi:hypothetical protein